MGEDEAEVKMKRIIESTKRFNTELKKSFVVAIITALSLITALAWQDVIREYLGKLTSFSPVQNKLMSALIITFVTAIMIFLLAKEPSKK